MPCWKHLRAVLLLPVVATLVIPYLLTLIPSRGLIGGQQLPIEQMLITRLSGFIVIYFGLLLFLSTVWLFIRHGQGTLAPWDPTAKLVVRGIYRRLRNPMILGVILLLIGETLFTRSFYHLAWTLFFIVANAIYIPLFEEPGLEKRFGEDYLEYKRNVPRWRPLLQPWEPVESATKSAIAHDE